MHFLKRSADLLSVLWLRCNGLTALCTIHALYSDHIVQINSLLSTFLPIAEFCIQYVASSSFLVLLCCAPTQFWSRVFGLAPVLPVVLEAAAKTV